MTLAIRARDASPGLVEEVKKQIWSLDGQIPVGDVHAMDELIAVSLAEQRFNMLLLGLFAALALILAAVGIYGAMAYAVNQRTHEIGIRTALGAQRRDVLRLVMRDGAKIALFGIASGIAGALALTRLMASLLFEVKPTDPATFAGVAIGIVGSLALTRTVESQLFGVTSTDPLTFGGVTLLLIGTALLACYIPARRATKVDPMVALRYE